MITTRIPKILADEMKKVCDDVGANESDFVRKSLITALESHNVINPSFEYL